IPEDSMTICFICAKRFRDEKCFHQHLQDSHNWARINEELNATFEFSRPLKCPYCSETKFEGLENNLYHVLKLTAQQRRIGLCTSSGTNTLLAYCWELLSRYTVTKLAGK
ncbi:hypothetical protein GE061_000010, partial [Apolygus lucorum]